MKKNVEKKNPLIAAAETFPELENGIAMLAKILADTATGTKNFKNFDEISIGGCCGILNRHRNPHPRFQKLMRLAQWKVVKLYIGIGMQRDSKVF